MVAEERVSLGVGRAVRVQGLGAGPLVGGVGVGQGGELLHVVVAPPLVPAGQWRLYETGKT